MNINIKTNRFLHFRTECRWVPDMYLVLVSAPSYLPQSLTKKSTKRPSKPTSPMTGITPSIPSLGFRKHTAVTHTREGLGQSCVSSARALFLCCAPFPFYHYACISIRARNLENREQKKKSPTTAKIQDRRSVGLELLRCRTS